MTLVTGTASDVAGGADPSVWTFYSVLREASDGTAVITTKHRRVLPDAEDGTFSIDLDPGTAVVEFDGKTYAVTVPESGPVTIWSLISAAVAFPPGTPADVVASAVAAYLDANPVSQDWADLVNTPAVIAAGASQAAARAAIDAASTTQNNIFPTVYYANVQAAVDAAAAAGGGTVMCALGPNYVPTGGIHLTSKVIVDGPPVRHANGYYAYRDGNGYYRPGKIDPDTGIAATDGAYLVPEAGSTGPMVWAGNYDSGYGIRNVGIFGVDVYGQDISAASIPSWTNSFAWIETAGTRTNTSTTLTCSVVQPMPQMVGQAVTGTGIQAGTTVSAVNVGAKTITLSLAATSTATGTASFTVAGGLPIPDVPISGRQAISFGSVASASNRPRCIIENVYTWGCGSGGPGAMANNRSWSETSATTVSGSNGVTLSSQTVSPLMIGAPVSGTGIPVGATISTISATTNRIFLSANATASGTGVALSIGGSSYTSELQQVYVGTPAVYVGCREAVVRGITCFMGGGDGLVIDAQDSQIDLDNMMGFNSGWGLWMTMNSGPSRVMGAIDSFNNGIYGAAGNSFIEGGGHVFAKLQCNTAGKENVKFGRCINTDIKYLNATDAGVRFYVDSARYSSVVFAAPAASASNPAWNTSANGGVVISGGNVSTKTGSENHFFEDVGSSVSIPSIHNMTPSGYLWNDGTPDNSVFAIAKNFTSGWRFIGGSFPDHISNGLGVAAFLRTSSSTTDALQVLHSATGAVQAGFGPNGALYQASASQTLSSNGAVTIDARSGNHHTITLAANATSSSITNPTTGQFLTITRVQDATGGRTWAWPSNCVFAGDDTPIEILEANGRSTVQFRYDGTNWREQSRSVNLTPPAGRLFAPVNYVSGNYYYCNAYSLVGTSNTLGNGTLRVTAFLVTKKVTISKLFAEFTAAGEANSVFRIGIFNDDGNSRPGTVLLDAGTISTGSGNAGNVATGGTPGVYEISVSQVLNPGLYWVGGVVQGASTTQPTMRIASSVTPFPGGPLGTSLPGAGGSVIGFSSAAGQSTLGTVSSPGSASSAARIGFKVA